MSFRFFLCILLSHGSLILRKLEPFGYPNRLLTWLSDYFTNKTQCAILGRKKSTLLASIYGVLQGAVLPPVLFPTYIGDLHASSRCQLFIYVDDVSFCQSVFEIDDLINFSNNLSRIHGSFSSLRLESQFVKM